MINDQGVCWCGQRWDGEKMCFAPAQQVPAETIPAADLDSGTSRPARPAT